MAEGLAKGRRLEQPRRGFLKRHVGLGASPCFRCDLGDLLIGHRGQAREDVPQISVFIDAVARCRRFSLCAWVRLIP
jgi:hypothetical protein